MPDTIFSQNEKDYLTTQRIARIATASVSSSEDGSRLVQPDVVPVGFDFDGEYIYVSGIDLLKSTKYKNVLKNRNVAVVIDDLKTVDPWDPRGIRIYGDADVVTRQGGYMDQTGHSEHHYIRIRPIKKWSWGIDISLNSISIRGKL
ncbi:MAG TPA: PPOX class F420-dependent oxidoreductase [Nitrososphaeraceae archaeon]|nr:PPOX class F420-dependent oxidoreductase [Nitrososphaeraceae archaeon]